MFSAVLIKTAVVGNHQNIQEAIFESPSQKTSLFLSNFSFLIFEAAFAEIIVSKTAIIATTVEVTKTVFPICIASLKLDIFILPKGNSPSLKVSSLNISESSSIFFGKYQLLINNQITIHTTVKNITEGNLGKYFFHIIKKLNHTQKIEKAVMFIWLILLKISTMFRYISLWKCIAKVGSFNHKAAGSWDKNIVIQTDIIKPWSVFEGISIIYFVIFKKYIISIIIQESIVTNGKSNAQLAQLDKTKAKSIDDKAQATQNTL